MDEREALLYSSALDRYKTSHVLHLILSIITGGGWLIVWALVAVSNSDARTKIQKALQDGKPYKDPSISGVVVFLVLLLVFIFIVAMVA